MKIVFISDIHGSKKYAELAQKAIEKENPDIIAILGDVLYHGPRNPLPEEYNPPAVSEILNSMAEKIVAVRGNCDSEVDQMIIKYPMMSDYNIIHDGKRKIFLTHGHIFSPEKMPHLNKGDIFAFGHVHISILEENKDGVIILNPGSTSLPKQESTNNYAVYEGDEITIKSLIDYSIIKTIHI